jgi:hypothetical protein
MKPRGLLLALLVCVACLGVAWALWIGLDVFIGSQ